MTLKALGVALAAAVVLAACTTAGDPSSRPAPTGPPGTAAGSTGPPGTAAGSTGTPGTAAGSTGTPGSLAHLQPTCPAPTGRRGIENAAAANRLVAQTDLPGWQAADIGASVRLSDGRIVWVFGDTLRRSPLSPAIVANSMLVTSGLCVSQLVPADRGAVLPDADPSTVYWPMSAAVLHSGSDEDKDEDEDEDELIVLCSRIRRGSQAYDFTFLGTSAAVFTVGPLGVPRLRRIEQITPDDTRTDQINWGAASVVHGDRLYVYGSRLTGRKLSFGRELHVARVPTSDPGNRRQWQFWDGTRWQREVRASVAVLPADGGVSQTLSVDVVRDRFLAVSKRDGDLGDFVYTWTSGGPTGPWTPRRAVRAPAGFDTGALQYAPLAHSEVPLANGQLLVSISRNTTDLGALVEDPRLGRPRFAQVALG